MHVSNSYSPYVAASAKSAATPRSAQTNSVAAAFSEYLDKVTLSPEARSKSQAWNYDSLTSVAADLKEYNRLSNDGRAQGYDPNTWLPENRARLEAIYAEMDQLDAADGYPDPDTRSDASSKKMWDLMSQKMVLEVYGDSKVVTDEMMAVGAAAYREAEREWADANGYQVEEWAQEGANATASLLARLSSNNKAADSEELEKQLEEWKNSQLADNGSSQAKKDFKSYMDKALNRGVIGKSKSPEEKIKELTAKIKTLKSQLGDVMTDQNLPTAVKSSRAQALNAQIDGLYAQIGELSKLIAEEGAAQGASAES